MRSRFISRACAKRDLPFPNRIPRRRTSTFQPSQPRRIDAPTGLFSGSVDATPYERRSVDCWFGAGVADLSFTTPDTANYSAQSHFTVRFEVNSPLSSTFNDTFTASSTPQASNVIAANAFGGLNGPGGAIFGFGPPNEFGPGTESGNPTFTGSLSPGMYTPVVRMLARAFADRGPETGAANASFAFTLDFTPAEPSPTPRA